MRRISWARADTALRPRAVSAPAWAAVRSAPWCATRRPCGLDTTSPFSRAHSNTSAARVAGRVRRDRRRAQPHLLVGADQQPQLLERPPPRGAGCSIAIAASTRPPFMSATPGPKQRIALAPERPRRHCPGREHGVRVPEQRDHASPRPRQRDHHAASRPVRLIHPLRAAAQRRQPAGQQLGHPLLLDARPTASRSSTSCCQPVAERLDHARHDAPRPPGRQKPYRSSRQGSASLW